jgi:hypothetical protein
MENIFQTGVEVVSVGSGDNSPVTNEVVQQDPATVIEPRPESPAPVVDNTPVITPEPVQPIQAAQPAPAPVDPWASITEQDVVKRFDKKALLKAAGYDDFAIDAAEYYMATGNLADYAEVKSVDYKQLPDEEIMRKHLRQEYASLDLTPEEFETLYREQVVNNFKLDPDRFSESEMSAGKILLKVQAARHRQQFIENQAKFKAPERQAAPEPQYVDPAAQIESAKQDVLGVPEVQQFLTERKVTLGTGDNAYNYEVNPEEILGPLYDSREFAVRTAVKDANGQIKFDANGQPVTDFKKMIKIAAFLKDMDAYESSLINHGKQLGERKIANELENPSNNQSTGAAGIIEPQNVWQAAKAGGLKYS